MSVQLRVDDYPLTKPDEAWRHTPQAFAAFDACIPVRYLLGVIPGNLGIWPDHSILNAGKIVVGMHGIYHDERFLDHSGGNEMAAVPVGRHSSVLAHGIALLASHGVCVDDLDVYMPPRNVIDKTTVDAMRHLFSRFTAGPETDQDVIEFGIEEGVLPIISVPPFEYGRSDELIQRGAIEHLYRAHDEGLTVVLGLHWTWESNIGLGTLVTLVKELGPILEDFHV